LEALNCKLKDLLNDSMLKKMYVIVSKTKSMFNRSLDELPKIKNTIKRYIDIDPEIAQYAVKILPNFPNSYFNMSGKYYGFGIYNSDVIAHELEHSLSLKEAPMYQKLLTTSSLLAAVGGLASPLAATYAKSKAENPDKLLDILSVAQGTVEAPKLYEEGKANVNAFLQSPEKWKAMKTLLPMFGTYLASAAVPIGMYQVAKHIGDKKQ
jgi:hypothetical protein